MEIRMGGCHAHGISYEVRGFPMLVVFWNKGVQAGLGGWGSGTPLMRELGCRWGWVLEVSPCEVGLEMRDCIQGCFRVSTSLWTTFLGRCEWVWIRMQGGGVRNLGRWVGVEGGSACLREVGMGGCLAQCLSYEMGGFPMLLVFWNKGAPARVGFGGVAHP